MTLRLAPPARWVTEYYQVTAQRPGPDGTIDVDLEVASEQWVRSLLFRLAPHATLLAPARLRRRRSQPRHGQPSACMGPTA